MSPTFTNPSSGWSAECRDCDYTIGLDYGEQIYPRSESGDRGDVEHWADKHVAEHPGHQPKIDQFARWTMTIVDVAPDVLETIFGPVGAPTLTKIDPLEIGACCGHEYGRHLLGLDDCADCEKWEPEHARCDGWRRQLPDVVDR